MLESELARKPPQVASDARSPLKMRRLNRWVCALAGYDKRAVESANELIVPWSLLLLACVNGFLAFFTSFLSLPIIFGEDLPGKARWGVSAVIAILVLLIDWMVVSWHPVPPAWYQAGQANPKRTRLVWGLGFGAVACAVVAAAAWIMQSFGEVNGSAGSSKLLWIFGSGVAAATFVVVALLLRHFVPTESRSWPPKMPGYLAMLPTFLARLSLSVFLGLIIGVGLGIVINRDVIEDERRDMVPEEVQKEERTRRENALKRDLADWEDTLGDLRDVAKARGEAYNALEAEKKDADDAVDKAQDKVTDQETRPGTTGTDFWAGERANAGKYAEEIGKQLEEAKKNKELAEAEVETHLLNRPSRANVVLQEWELVDPESKERAMRGLAPTLDAQERAANENNWSFWMRWGPELAIILFDAIPVLIKFILGHRRPEQRMWDMAVEEMDDWHKRWLPKLDESARAAAEQGSLEFDRSHGKRMSELSSRMSLKRLEAVEEVRTQTAIAVAEVEGEIAINAARLAADAAVNPRENRGVSRAMQSQEPSEYEPLEQEDSGAELGATVREIETVEHDTPGLGQQQVEPEQGVSETVRVLGAEYVVGPLMGVFPGYEEQPSTLNRVHFAVRAPLAAPNLRGKCQLTEMGHLRGRSIVIKRKSEEMSDEAWGQIMDNHDKAQSVYARADRETNIISSEYLDLGDLGGHLMARLEEGVPVEWLELSRWATSVAKDLSLLHERGYVHNDVKLTNVLLGSKHVDYPGESGADKTGATAVLSDFDGLTREGEATRYVSKDHCAPELLEAGESGGIALPAAKTNDAFCLGAMLFEAITGQAVNRVVMWPMEFSDWMHRYRQQYASEISSKLQGAPEPVRKLVLDLLSPDPEQRPVEGELLRRCEAMTSSCESAGAFAVPHGLCLPPTKVWGADVLDTFERAGFDITQVRELAPPAVRPQGRSQ